MAGRRAWVAGAAGPVALADDEGEPGAAVALGPADADEVRARGAVTQLRRLVAAGGVEAAGAGVDLGGGFRSARLAGARGDHRDAVLAALRAVGPEDAERVGERGAVLVALFGPEATKRVGAAATRAVGEGRWAAVRLASAASDLLGPEQLERVLALEAPEGVDPVGGGAASELAGQLRQVLEPVPGARRLGLVVDLWGRALGVHAAAARRRRLLGSQGKQDRTEALRERREHHEDERFLQSFELNRAPGQPTTPGALARWIPPEHLRRDVLNRLLADAYAATALLHAAVAVCDHGAVEGLARVEPLLAAAGEWTSDGWLFLATQRVPGLTGLPARPGVRVRELLHLYASDGPRDDVFADRVREYLAHARDYALVIADEVVALGDVGCSDPDPLLCDWARLPMAAWRERSGLAVTDRPPAPEWVQSRFGLTADRPDGDEIVGELRWYADLMDALARLYGHDAAGRPWHGDRRFFDHDPEPEPDPLTPRLDSVALAVSGAAQLVALGARPAKAADWPAFTAALLAGVDVSAALSGEFPVPPPLAAVDGSVVPGTAARFRVARSARTLAVWAAYMGNCIAGSLYTEGAAAGRSVLGALCDERGTVLANVELLHQRPAHRGWRISEIAGRFNATPDPELERRFRAWVTTLPGVRPPEPEPRDERDAAGRPARRKVPPVHEAAGPALAALLTPHPYAGVFTALAGTAPDAALTHLRRLDQDSLVRARRRVMADTDGLRTLWAATAARPLTDAVARLDPALRERYSALALLTEDTPLPRSLRHLVRLPALAPAYSAELVSRRIRTALGRLVSDDDPALARALSRRPTVPLLCALTVTALLRPPATALVQVAPPRKITVPGYPASSLADEDGPWRRALPVVAELGVDTGPFWDRVAADGLRVPRSWLTAGGWPVLWGRAHG
ncbi:hypothetical protein SRB5_33920 [Streptomyces sp. RB5]|uniref:Uncharacterized protein n=1 Tax=Streptomyces smaragdinus TaxID=2585196 RepID=A0A7K0CIE2_9ACTN|nr:hypothetical protein [Streptomyces smaragdinus]